MYRKHSQTRFWQACHWLVPAACASLCCRQGQVQEERVVAQGNSACCSSAVSSGRPHNRFMFWMACPEAPLTRLSMTAGEMRGHRRSGIADGEGEGTQERLRSQKCRAAR